MYNKYCASKQKSIEIFSIPAWQRNLHNTYNISMLNSLHHIVLEPFEQRNSINSTQLISPVFSIADDHLSIVFFSL